MALSEEIRNELVKLQYGSIDRDAVIELLKQHQINDIKPEDVMVYTSDGEGIDRKIGGTSGFDGAAIHIYNEESGRNEVYYIARGTELDSSHDVVYDMYGVAGGVADDQIADAQEFFREVEENVSSAVSNENIDSIKRYGDGHSLGGHIIATLALLEKGFTDVRGLNAAPVHLKQLIELDDEFRQHIDRVTGGKDADSLSQKELQDLAKDYYKAEIAHIKQYRVKGEPLYAQTIPFGFFFGDIHYLGHMGTPEFPNLLDTYDSGAFNVDRAIYHSFMATVLWLLRRSGKEVSVDDTANLLDSLGPGDYAYLVKTFGPVVVLMLFNPTFLKQVITIWQQFDQVDLHDIDVVMEEFVMYNALRSTIEALKDPSRRSEVMAYIANIGSVFGKDQVALFYRQLRILLGLGGSGHPLVVSIDSLEVLYELEVATEELVATGSGVDDEIVVTKMTVINRALAMRDKFKETLTIWGEKTLTNVDAHQQFIIQYWEKDEEIARNIS
ncbi:DUF6792 domain-containing protein [Shouchella lonarensis]|uniref:DUF6792 domain-containing protein n=1 Tax=Shouchella lonarensis TaxID=1464122 RepID=A0A1G6I0I6_9BACI|nr:DUF6792 domain-containing protein [Shouchella lonarensis]SDB99585.1 hypothetical protein SAMN05421737_104246 [Shouchella lonarensis]